MTKEEREILRKLATHREGLISPADFINTIANRNGRAVQNLIVKGYVETAPATRLGSTYDFYRATEKGLMEFAPLLSKLWFYFSGDLRTITVSIVTALLTSVVFLILGLSI